MFNGKLDRAKAATAFSAGLRRARPRKPMRVIQYPETVGKVTREMAEAAVDAVMRRHNGGAGMPPPPGPPQGTDEIAHGSAR